jgi:hypothetical protein
MITMHVSSMVMSKKAWAELNDGKQEFTILRANWDGITGDVVAVVWDDDDAEEKRIAALFSAAPQLLEALEEFMPWGEPRIGADGLVNLKCTREQFNKARAAIKKATGQ